MRFAKELLDEQQGAKHYKDMAKKYPDCAEMFNSMAEDELKHHKMLEDEAGEEDVKPMKAPAVMRVGKQGFKNSRY